MQTTSRKFAEAIHFTLRRETRERRERERERENEREQCSLNSNSEPREPKEQRVASGSQLEDRETGDPKKGSREPGDPKNGRIGSLGIPVRENREPRDPPPKGKDREPSDPKESQRQFTSYLKAFWKAGIPEPL